MCLFMVFTGSCMFGLELPTNYHMDLESLIRKSHSSLSSLGSSGSHNREIVNEFQGSPPPHEPTLMVARKCINDFSYLFSANIRTGLEMNIRDSYFELKPVLLTWCCKAHSTVRPQKMLMLILNTSWRSAAHSLSEE
jgi:hypothetical protein